MKLKVVYLDDEPMLCELFRDEFLTDQIEIHTFVEPNDAIAFVGSEAPDLIFLDYRLPGTTGDRIAQRMKPKIPTYLITGDVTLETQYKFTGRFPKPTNAAEIHALLANALRAKQNPAPSYG